MSAQRAKNKMIDSFACILEAKHSNRSDFKRVSFSAPCTNMYRASCWFPASPRTVAAAEMRVSKVGTRERRRMANKSRQVQFITNEVSKLAPSSTFPVKVSLGNNDE